VRARLYFAYGSNLHPVRLGKRCPSAQLVGSGQLSGWRMEFRKRGRDGSAKGDAVWTGRPEDHLWFAAYELRPADKAHLDAVEGVGQGYREEPVCARGTDLPSFLYVAEAAAVDAGLVPFDWYHAMVVAGATFHGFPQAYLAELQAVPTVFDPDARRSAEQWEVVAEMAAAAAAGPGLPGRQGERRRR